MSVAKRPEAADPGGSSLGEKLRNLRKNRGLTGKELGDLAGMSQSKISRLESGATALSDEDFVVLARMLGVDEADARQLIAEVRFLRGPVGDWQTKGADAAHSQHDTERVEAEATDFKVFQPTVVIGLMQINTYAEAVLVSLQSLTRPDLVGVPGEAVAARMRRQAILYDRRKHFDFVMSEAVLGNRICAAEDMLAQIHRVQEIAKLPNVAVSIIPASIGRWKIPPYHGFTILDDKHLFVDLYETGLSKHDPADADLYNNVFGAMKGQATTDIGPILERYRRLYLDELTGNGGISHPVGQ